MFAVKGFTKDQKDAHVHLRMDNRTAVFCQPHGRNPLPITEQTSYPALAVVPEEEPVSISRVPTRGRQLYSIRGIQVDLVVSRVEAAPEGISTDNSKVRRVCSGPLCFPAQCSTGAICQLEARSTCYGDGCSATSMKQGNQLCFSSNLQVPQEGQGEEGITSAGTTNMEVTAVVPSFTGATDRLPHDSSRGPRAVDGPLWQPTPTSSGRPVAVSRLETIRLRQLTTGISGETSQLLAAGWSSGTNTAYHSAWNRWSSWCAERQADPLSCPIGPFLEFLTEEGLQYRSINTIRSVVSMTHDHIEGNPIGRHPLVSRLLKGVYNSCPPQPRYSATWDVDVVIRYLQSMGDNETLLLKQLSQKLALLMALVDASRVSELQALDLRYRTYRPEGVVFQLPTLSKKRVMGAPPKQMVFGAFPEDSRLCVAKCLRQYEAVTSK